jgi:hypothetical protein
MEVPQGAGLGTEPLQEVLDEVTIERHILTKTAPA